MSGVTGIQGARSYSASQAMRRDIALRKEVLIWIISTEDGPVVTVDAEEVMFAVRSIQSRSDSSKSHARRVIQVRQLLLKYAAKAAESVANARGMSADLVKAITAEILGVRA